ncbi:sulfatase-like hydrolase/transferase [Xanthomarina gelatinilytica]|uniref:sulfatase-like hydrolase/transferase n=1 Tax=Xanthomarina gelatinilytica TaxID=1137281 RepID=UPI003AA8FEFB
MKKLWHKLTTTKPVVFFLLFPTLFCVFLFLDSFPLADFLSYTFRIKGLFKFFAAIFLYLGLTFSATVFLMAKNIILRIVAFCLLFLTLGTQYGYKHINGFGFSFFDANTLLSEMGFAGDALSTFLPEVLNGLIVILVFTILLAIAVSKYAQKIKTRTVLPSIAFFFALGYFVTWSTSGDQVYPTMFKIPLLLTYASNYSLYNGPREDLELSNEKPSEYKHIIFLVDESVRGDYFSINDKQNPTTPYLASISGKLVNYGIASSGTNTSATANFILRSGAGSETFPDPEQMSLKRPNIFQYAKNAGFKTIFMDGQKGYLQNFMRKDELEYLDVTHFVEEGSMPRYDIDNHLAVELIKTIEESKAPTFSYIVKMGAHFHYETCYPQNEKVFTPTMEIGTLNSDSIKMRNSYRNAIRWSVDLFFKNLIPQLPDSTLVVYTSDHGQNLLEHGIKSTHSDFKNPSPFQAMVPLFFYFSDSTQHSQFNYLAQNYNQASHFNIFPTIVKLMGYSDSALSGLGLKSLFDPLENERMFYSGNLFLSGNLEKNLFDNGEMKHFINTLNPPKVQLSVNQPETNDTISSQ